ncbi:MAG: hypothetical protein GY720_15005 [bacterium]|nr:hypothetical protein [bacterium]
MTYTVDRSTVHRFEPVSHVFELVLGALGTGSLGLGAWLSVAPVDGTLRILWWTGDADAVSHHWSSALAMIGLIMLSIAFGILTSKQARGGHRASGGALLAAFLSAGTAVAALIVATIWIL